MHQWRPSKKKILTSLVTFIPVNPKSYSHFCGLFVNKDNHMYMFLRHLQLASRVQSLMTMQFVAFAWTVNVKTQT